MMTGSRTKEGREEGRGEEEEEEKEREEEPCLLIFFCVQLFWGEERVKGSIKRRDTCDNPCSFE